MVIAAGVAHNGRKRHVVSEIFEGIEIPLNEGGAFKEVKRKIPADAEFGKDSEVGTAAFAFLCELENTRGIAFKVPDRWVELREGYLHAD
jgi:hypothetical protein